MRPTKVLLGLAAVLGLAQWGMAASSTPGTGSMTGGPHDLRLYYTATPADVSSDEFCIPCHTPHNGNLAAHAPLWNHKLSQDTYLKTDWRTGQKDIVVTMRGTTKLCMGCHDGLTAVDAFGGSEGTAGNTIKEASAAFTDLGAHHPVGQEYPASGPYYSKDAAVTYTLHGSTVTGQVKDFLEYEDGTGGGVAGQYYVECGSCHSPHLRPGSSGVKVSMSNSFLCRVCHTF